MMDTIDQIVARLKQEADPEVLNYRKSKFNIVANNGLGLSQKQMDSIAREIPKNNQLALDLYNTGIYEARLLCCKLYNPKDLTMKLVDQWVKDFENWEICDSFSLAQFAKSPLAISIIEKYPNSKPEYQRRTSFSTIAGFTMADKEAPNATFEEFFPLIEQASTDSRIYVKKAVDWALRNIGKRNKDLNKDAIQVAEKLMFSENATAQWIGKQSFKELTKENVRISDYPRSIYRKSN